MTEALKEFNDALNACEEDYRLDWEPGDSVVVVQVLDADGRHPVAAFARRIADRAAEQGFLLEERERTVLEDELLAGLAQQIFDRVLVARDPRQGHGRRHQSPGRCRPVRRWASAGSCPTGSPTCRGRSPSFSGRTASAPSSWPACAASCGR